MGNFMDEYLYLVGDTEVPLHFHWWAGWSLLSAALRDRVTVQREAERATVPNLYVCLIGHPGVGKNNAVDQAHQLALAVGIRTYTGQITGQAIPRMLVTPQGKGRLSDPRVYLLTEELGNSVPAGEHAYAFFTMMTELYNGHKPYTKTTVKDRAITVPAGHCITWLAGVQPEVLVKLIPKTALESGFFQRVIAVSGWRDPSIRKPYLTYPEDRAGRRAALLDRLHAYRALQGTCTLTSEAKTRYERWYYERPAPDDARLLGHFFKASEFLTKFMLLAAVAAWQPREGDFSYRVTAADVETAIEAWDRAMTSIGLVFKIASATPRTEQLDMVRAYVRQHGPCQARTLQQRMASRGLLAPELKGYLQQLYEHGEIDGSEHKREPRLGSFPWGELEWLGGGEDA